MSTSTVPPRLETPRLVLRPWAFGEAGRLLDMWRDPEFVRYLPGADPMEREDDAWVRIARWHERSRTAPIGWWAVEVAETGVVAGTVLLCRPHGTEPAHEVGWQLHPDSRGHGYATEAARVVVEHGLAHGLPEVFACVDARNTASVAVVERLGMTEVDDRGWYGDGWRYWVTGP